MKQVLGVWLPDSERHFAESTYLGERYPALDRALNYLPADRRRMAIDVGAHIGLWSKWLVNEFASVEAFEPVREFAEIMPRNMNGSTNYRLHGVALGETYGAVAMKHYPENTGQTHIRGDGDVTMLSLDSYGFKDVDLIKIDVEGYELQVVKGAERTLRESRPLVVIEQRGCEVVNFGERQRDQALAWLKGIGMKPVECVHHDWIMRF